MDYERMTQEERLALLVEAFKKDSVTCADLETPGTREERQALLRALMNIRMPGPLPEEVLALQDAYLQERAREKGIVTLSEIPAGRDRLSIWQGDITRLQADAIVNAANSQMLGCFVPLHTCIDNCIHTYAGVRLRAECGRQMRKMKKRYGPSYEQPVGVPLLTDAYNLPARKVIHVAGPIVEGDLTPSLEADLSACYRNVLDLCLREGLRTVAFCCISTGVFRFPGRRAAEIAVRTVRAFMKAHPEALDRVIFNVFKDEDRAYYEELLQEQA